MKAKFLATLLAIVGAIGTAHATAVTPVSGSSFSEIDWATLNLDQNTLALADPVGVVTAGAAGGVYTSDDSSLGGSTVLNGQDTLLIRFTDFSVNQVLFNSKYRDNIKSQMIVHNTHNNRNIYQYYLLNSGDISSFDIYLPVGINEIYFTAVDYGIDNFFSIGSIYLTNSSTPLNGQGFNLPDAVPEPETFALLGIGLLGIIVIRSGRALFFL